MNTIKFLKFKKNQQELAEIRRKKKKIWVTRKIVEGIEFGGYYTQEEIDKKMIEGN